VKQSYLAQHVATLKPSGIRKFFDIVATMDDVISLGIGEPDFITPQPVLDAGILSLQAGKTHYTSNLGTIELRQEVAKHLHGLYGTSYDPESEVVITVGVSEALYLALTAILNPDEEVIVPSPCFVSYPAEVILAGGVPVEIPTYARDGFMPQPDALEAAITERSIAILIGYPN
jgi:aminotransferase